MSSSTESAHAPVEQAITVVALILAVVLVLMATGLRVTAGLEVTDAAAVDPSALVERGRLAGARVAVLLSGGLALGWIGRRGATGASARWLLRGISRVGVLTAVAALASGMWVTSVLAISGAATCAWVGRRTFARAPAPLSAR